MYKMRSEEITISDNENFIKKCNDISVNTQSLDVVEIHSDKKPANYIINFTCDNSKYSSGDSSKILYEGSKDSKVFTEDEKSVPADDKNVDVEDTLVTKENIVLSDVVTKNTEKIKTSDQGELMDTKENVDRNCPVFKDIRRCIISIYKLRPVEETQYHNFETFINKLYVVINEILTLRNITYIWEPLIVKIILMKLDNFSRSRWSIFNANKPKMSIKKMVQFLNNTKRYYERRGMSKGNIITL